jgi:uncharacterized protein involved in cysteine biosynthesis
MPGKGGFMALVLDALSRAFRDLFRFQVLWIVVWPVLAAALLWIILGVAFWDTLSEWITSGLTAIGVQTWLEDVKPSWIAHGIQVTIHVMLFVPLVFATALVLTALFAMTALIRLVADRDYPQLESKSGGGFIGSLANALIAVAIFLGIWLITLPLWILGVGMVVPFAAAAYLNQRLFRYDALVEHASHEEMRVIFSTHQASLWGLGLLTGLVQFIPFFNLFAPVLAALAFIHFGLARLAALRRPPLQ